MWYIAEKRREGIGKDGIVGMWHSQQQVQIWNYLLIYSETMAIGDDDEEDRGKIKSQEKTRLRRM